MEAVQVDAAGALADAVKGAISSIPEDDHGAGMWVGKCLVLANAAFLAAFHKSYMAGVPVTMGALRQSLRIRDLEASASDPSLPLRSRRVCKAALEAIPGYRANLGIDGLSAVALDWHACAACLVEDALSVLPPQHPALAGVDGIGSTGGPAKSFVDGTAFRSSASMERWREALNRGLLA